MIQEVASGDGIASVIKALGELVLAVATLVTAWKGMRHNKKKKEENHDTENR